MAFLHAELPQDVFARPAASLSREPFAFARHALPANSQRATPPLDRLTMPTGSNKCPASPAQREEAAGGLAPPPSPAGPANSLALEGSGGKDEATHTISAPRRRPGSAMQDQVQQGAHDLRTDQMQIAGVQVAAGRRCGPGAGGAVRGRAGPRASRSDIRGLALRRRGPHRGRVRGGGGRRSGRASGLVAAPRIVSMSP